MQYTIDSISHVEAALKEKYKQARIVSTPLLTTSTDDFVAEDDNTFYFGVMTVGPLDFPGSFYVHNGPFYIILDSNSQITVFFKYIYNSVVGLPPFQFRGFRIKLEY